MMSNSRKNQVYLQFPKITETLLTLLLLNGEIGFIISVFKLCTLDSPQTGPISVEHAMTLLWMTLRSVTDMFMGLIFFFALFTKTHNSDKYHRWISYGMFATCFDVIFALILFQKPEIVGLGIEATSLIIDGLVKITIALIMNDLRKKSKSSQEGVPLLA